MYQYLTIYIATIYTSPNTYKTPRPRRFTVTHYPFFFFFFAVPPSIGAPDGAEVVSLFFPPAYYAPSLSACLLYLFAEKVEERSSQKAVSPISPISIGEIGLDIPSTSAK
jgi:hypothetical protein